MAILGILRDHPGWLEAPYQWAERVFKRLDPLIQKIGYQRVDRWIYSPEKLAKQMIFDCKMCGQCTLHFTGMTCPMNCPKNMRNGPCGGVRIDKTCEVDPGMKCVWVEAYERSVRMKIYRDSIKTIRAPLNHRLAGKSAFINLLSGEGDGMPPAWMPAMGSENLNDRK